jgi:hypothetical protein
LTEGAAPAANEAPQRDPTSRIRRALHVGTSDFFTAQRDVFQERVFDWHSIAGVTPRRQSNKSPR